VLSFKSTDGVRYQSMQHALLPPNHILAHKPLIGSAEAMEASFATKVAGYLNSAVDQWSRSQHFGAEPI